MYFIKRVSLFFILVFTLNLYGCSLHEENILDDISYSISDTSDEVNEELFDGNISDENNNQLKEVDSLKELLVEEIEIVSNDEISGDRSFSQEKVEESNLIIMISNQSFDNPEVRIKGYINGEKLFEDSFEVGIQHLVSYYYLNLEEGEYNLSFESEDDAILSDVITIDEEQLWVYLTYWKDDNTDSHMDIFKQNEPLRID